MSGGAEDKANAGFVEHWEGESDGSPAPRERLAELREFLVERIDGSEETRAWDTKITGFIADIDAPSPEPLRGKYCPSCGMDTYYWLKHSGRCATCGFHWGVSPPSEMVAIKDQRTECGEESSADSSKPQGSQVANPASVHPTPKVDLLERTTMNPADWVDLARTLERECAELRGQLDRMRISTVQQELEMEGLREKLRAATSMPCAPSATGAMPKAFYEIVEVANTEGMPDSTPLPIWPKDVAWDFTPLTVGDIRAMLAAAPAPALAEPVAWTTVLKMIERGMAVYKERHPKWWKRMDGTPILNDLPVVIATEICETTLYTAPQAAPVEVGAIRVLSVDDSFCPNCGHNRDTSSVSSIDNEDGTNTCQRCGTSWREVDAPDMKGEQQK